MFSTLLFKINAKTSFSTNRAYVLVLSALSFPATSTAINSTVYTPSFINPGRVNLPPLIIPVLLGSSFKYTVFGFTVGKDSGFE